MTRSALRFHVGGFTVVFVLHRNTMFLVLFQDIRNVDERIRVDRFRDDGEEGRVESTEGSVILQRDLIRVAGCIRLWRFR